MRQLYGINGGECEHAPLVSVVVPVYNVATYLGQCLQSIIDQTYESLEVIVVDDGSTDGCATICDAFCMYYGCCNVIHTENRGLSAARNLGIDSAHGTYLLFIDGDDWIEPQAVERLVCTALQAGADVVTCRFLTEWLDGC